jgi:hypothetical protein
VFNLHWENRYQTEHKKYERDVYNERERKLVSAMIILTYAPLKNLFLSKKQFLVMFLAFLSDVFLWIEFVTYYL